MKTLFKLTIALVIALVFVRFMFPPLNELGYTSPESGEDLQVMFDRNGGVEPLLIYVELRDGLDFADVSAELCADIIADRSTGALPLKGLPEAGQIEFRFVTGGRYFYRFAEERLVITTYDTESCTEIRVVGGSFP